MAGEPCLADPLAVLPPELVLRILEFSPVSTLASLLAVSKAWHQFIDVTHQHAIYGAESKTIQPPGCTRDFEFLSHTCSISGFFDGISSWKELCKRQTLLARNWGAQHPVSQESVLQIGNDSVWRFRADFKRRFFISTSHLGGLNVTDMDSGCILWRLPSTLDHDQDAVRPYAHLEYQDGMAVFDSEGDTLEVWQTDLDGAARGEFRRIAILNHNCQTRGFQFSYWTLCVVSEEGQGFVYDMTQRPPILTTRLEIERGAVGHLDQCEDAVICSLGEKGYYAYDKKSGNFLGVLHPSNCTQVYHILSSAIPFRASRAQLLNGFRPRVIKQISIAQGRLPAPSDPEHVRNREDEWGAGMLDGELFVGFSRAGRVFVCPEWRQVLHGQSSLAAHGFLVECESDGANFDLGGWLSVRDHRVLFEIQDRVYLIALDDNNRIQNLENPQRASFSILTSSAPQLAVPVSYMTLCDDGFLTTFGTLGWRQSTSDAPYDPVPGRAYPARIFPTKAIRTMSLAPDLSNSESTVESSGHDYDPVPRTPKARSGPGQPTDQMWQSQEALLRLVSLLGDDPHEWEDREDHEGDHDGA